MSKRSVTGHLREALEGGERGYSRSARVDMRARSVKLRVTVPDDNFEPMQDRARSYRKCVAELGSVSGSVIIGNVRDRLLMRTGPEPLTRAHGELADEIIAFLTDRRLSRHQAAALEREFFGR